jgi:hypothetical protein
MVGKVFGITTLTPETFFSIDKETIIPPSENVSDDNLVTLRAIAEI